MKRILTLFLITIFNPIHSFSDEPKVFYKDEFIIHIAHSDHFFADTHGVEDIAFKHCYALDKFTFYVMNQESAGKFISSLIPFGTKLTKQKIQKDYKNKLKKFNRNAEIKEYICSRKIIKKAPEQSFYSEKSVKQVGMNYTFKFKDEMEILQNKIKKEEENKKLEEERLVAEEKRKKEEERKKITEEKKIAEAKKEQEEIQKRKEANSKLVVIGLGTGFFVSSDGHVVSNDHVVGICRKVVSKIDGTIINFNVINTDKVNDLGLIKGEYKSKHFLNIKSGGAEFGEDIITFGYPLSNDLSDSVKLTRGIVSSLSGPGNNYSEIQIDAAIQPGSSGGPVLNMEGQVVGVASSGLNKITKLLDENSPYIPENVNFAVASATLTNFLKANGVNVSNALLKISNTKELAKIGRPATLQLFCMNTKAVHEELKKKKKHSDVLLEKVMELR